MAEQSAAPADPLAPLYSEVERYYTRKMRIHGPTPLGVDWSCIPTQELRFVQLLKVCDVEPGMTLNDLGCGYGALLAFLAKRAPRAHIDYLGIDLSSAMITHARRLWQGRRSTRFMIGCAPLRVADYSVASGIFNVKLGQPEALWTQFVRTTLTKMHSTSRRGFAVNFLAPARDGSHSPPEIYRSSSSTWQRFCEEVLGAQVTVLNNYGMGEYTLLVRPQA